MKSKKIIQRFVAIVIIISLITQDFSFTSNANSSDDNVETVYVDGIEFNVVENKDGIEINGEYEGEVVNVSYSGEENVDVSIQNGSSQDDYTLVFDDFNDVVDELIDDIDIDAFIDADSYADSIEEEISTIEIEDVLEEHPVEIYDENNKLVDTVDFQGYEGQITITVAGTASYYILSAIASFIFTYQVYTIIKASTASKSKAKRKGGVAIPKDQVPRRRKKNKKVKGKNGSLSTTGTPDSSTDLYSKNGKKLYQRRFYDRKGKVFLDIDFSHGGNHIFPHAHYWIWY
ncbi:MAG: hypothetical protein HFH37_05305 [Lachnospiraceae bacterium]|mgnify:FL=1|nr:hypothetical protein [Lachnospiraceae bacterium]